MSNPKLLALLLAGVLCPSSLAAQDCSQTSTGFVPLNDLGTNLYQGVSGGLYPGGVNMAPAAHHAAGLAQAGQIQPLDARGAPDPGGRIGFLSIGMSNGVVEFDAFLQQAAGDALKDPSVVPVNGCSPGAVASIIKDPAAPYWTLVAAALAQANVTAEQVQVVWIKEANPAPTETFLPYAEGLRDDLRGVCQTLHGLFPNTKLAYFASRIYGGYSSDALNPEPYAYWQGFAVKWLIEQQIEGDPGLNFDPGQGPVESAWLGWGTYNWADGLNPRSDGLTWECSDFDDGTHPTLVGGGLKVAQLLKDFLHTDATAKVWYLASPTTVCPVQATVEPYGTAFGGPNGVAQLVLSDLATVPTVKGLFAHVWNAPTGAVGGFVLGVQPFPDGLIPVFGGSLLVDPLLVSVAVTDANGKASLPLGAMPDDPGLCGVSVYVQAAVQDADSALGYDVTEGLKVTLGS
ncbi:MAG: hypothetical protein AAF682_22825 [Planctomycetota bacterium]